MARAWNSQDKVHSVQGADLACAVSEEIKLKNHDELQIRVYADAESRTLTVEDTGIGKGCAVPYTALVVWSCAFN